MKQHEAGTGILLYRLALTFNFKYMLGRRSPFPGNSTYAAARLPPFIPSYHTLGISNNGATTRKTVLFNPDIRRISGRGVFGFGWSDLDFDVEVPRLPGRSKASERRKYIGSVG
eukprot:1172684-Amorphochlora_amoeboformis.AAC.1